MASSGTGSADRLGVTLLFSLIAHGVFALGLVVGSRAGVAAFGALGHYVLVVTSVGGVVWISGFALAWIGGRTGPLTFLRASIPAQAVAISTQSSLASLPAMLTGENGGFSGRGGAFGMVSFGLPIPRGSRRVRP